VIRVADRGDTERVQELFREYADGVGVDLSFQDFDRELADPFAVYELVLLAAHGCVALRRIDAQTCEMKRLYVRGAARGTGLGRALASTLISHARAKGYDRMRLDTLPTMAAARGLYAALGFREIAAYRPNPIHGTTYFELDLAS
jgi:ribosomal protein S18 acetylase RimI-like enzyme